ncbi:hypothetical protein [Candidatus Phytoplasma sp. AldY-WA1]|uniref:hypothetical protein n=1 Tax=Candidatus Phytoplasma sp. AldY-WA1 TaxID=2852100 RepID=UPI00254FA38F|nr:hypothetical protein [Candidatus Phytoplasma sp. AldY-WA1]
MKKDLKNQIKEYEASSQVLTKMAQDFTIEAQSFIKHTKPYTIIQEYKDNIKYSKKIKNSPELRQMFSVAAKDYKTQARKRTVEAQNYKTLVQEYKDKIKYSKNKNLKKDF